MCSMCYVFCHISVYLCHNLRYSACCAKLWQILCIYVMYTNIWSCRCNLTFFCRDKLFFSNLVTAGKFCCRGSHHWHMLSSSKRGRMLEPDKFKMIEASPLTRFWWLTNTTTTWWLLYLRWWLLKLMGVCGSCCVKLEWYVIALITYTQT